MIKRSITIILTIFLLAGCGTRAGKETAVKKAADEGIIKVEFASLVSNPSDYIDKNIEIEGKVTEVCPHTGKKMFITGDNPDVSLYIAAGENSDKFPSDLVGSKILVTGKLEKIEAAGNPGDDMGLMEVGMKGCGGCAGMAGEGRSGSDTAAKESGSCCDTVKTASSEAGPALASQSSLGNLMMIYNKHQVIK